MRREMIYNARTEEQRGEEDDENMLQELTTEDYFQCRGDRTFALRYENGEYKLVYRDELPADDALCPRFDIGDVFEGKEFLDDVEAGYLTDYDGGISGIIVDDMRTNLGLAVENLVDGRFLVTEDTFAHLCDNFDVKVIWCNR